MTVSPNYRQRQVQNTLQTVFLIGGMLALLAVLGYALGGIGWLFVFVVFATITMSLAPRIGIPMLFRFYRASPISPLNAPRLYRILVELSHRAELPRPPTLYYIPSHVHNAFAVGTGNDAAIGVTDAILRDFSTREVAGILAHEISHVRNRDTVVMGLADAISRFSTILSHIGLFFVVLNLPLILLGVTEISWLAVLLMISAPTIAALLQLGLSRTREYAADADGARLTGDPEALASALARLERIQGGNWERILLPGRRLPEPSLLRTHPPTEDRIRRLLELAPAPAMRSIPAREPESLFDALAGARSRPGSPGWHFFGNWY